ncbi:hypothetical protein M0802_006965 [Mischocyttarus mexicanus]|nr:hypothetical protein M0802_006965 [Mischocyttarus mexicanus]
MTKNRCKICELFGECQIPNHGLSHPCHLTNLHQLNHHLAPGSNYNSSPSMNYLNHGLLNGLYLPQLKDMMLAAYLLRAQFSDEDLLLERGLLYENWKNFCEVFRSTIGWLVGLLVGWFVGWFGWLVSLALAFLLLKSVRFMTGEESFLVSRDFHEQIKIQKCRKTNEDTLVV